MRIYSNKHGGTSSGPGTNGPMHAVISNQESHGETTGLYIRSDAMKALATRRSTLGADLEREWFVVFTVEETREILRLMLADEGCRVFIRENIGKPKTARERESYVAANIREARGEALASAPETPAPQTSLKDHLRSTAVVGAISPAPTPAKLKPPRYEPQGPPITITDLEKAAKGKGTSTLLPRMPRPPHTVKRED